MEKCTYCVQRIKQRAHRIGKTNRSDPRWRDRHSVRTGLPDEAIVRNANDKASRVAKLKAQQRNYRSSAD